MGTDSFTAAETNGVKDFENGHKHYVLFTCTALSATAEQETPKVSLEYYQMGKGGGPWNLLVYWLNTDASHALTARNYYDYLLKELAIGQSLTGDKIEINNFFNESGVVSTLAATINEMAVYNQPSLPSYFAVGATGNASPNQVDCKVLLVMVRV